MTTALPNRCCSATTSGSSHMRASPPVSTAAPAHVGARENSGSLRMRRHDDRAAAIRAAAPASAASRFGRARASRSSTWPSSVAGTVPPRSHHACSASTSSCSSQAAGGMPKTACAAMADRRSPSSRMAAASFSRGVPSVARIDDAIWKRAAATGVAHGAVPIVFGQSISRCQNVSCSASSITSRSLFAGFERLRRSRPRRRAPRPPRRPARRRRC